MPDSDQFSERAAIREYLGGMTRFDAETAAAREQGFERWQIQAAAKEARDEVRSGPVAGNGHHRQPMGGERDANDMPGMQCRAAEENRPLLERQPEAGRDRGELLALRVGEGGAL